MNVALWRGGGTEECWIGQKEEREEWKDEEKVNEESDAPGEPFLGSRRTYKCTHTHTRTHLNTVVKPQ